jgi:hypothetical protein
VQAGFFALLSECQVGKLEAVGGHLRMREPHLLGEAKRVEEAWIDGRFAAGKLYDAPATGR